MSNITLKELNDSLTPERIIELVTSLGSDEYIEKNDCIIFKTICHNVDAADASLKLYYYKRNKIFHCYTECGSFNIFDLFERRYETLGIPYDFYRDIVLKIADGVKGRPQDSGFYSKYESNYNTYKVDKPKVYLPPINPSVLNIFSNYMAAEWLSEGITQEAMKDYNILYSIEQNKIIIPHYDINNNLIGIRGRALNPEDIEIGKYMPIQIENRTYSHPLMYNLYGLNKVKDNINRIGMAIVTEGEKGPLMYQSYYGKDRNICVATCGSTFHRYQLDLLLKCGAKKVLIAFDKEGDNYKSQTKYFNKLKSICNRYKNICHMGFIFDSNNLLELKDSPLDKGEDVFNELAKRSVWV